MLASSSLAVEKHLAIKRFRNLVEQTVHTSSFESSDCFHTAGELRIRYSRRSSTEYLLFGQIRKLDMVGRVSVGLLRSPMPTHARRCTSELESSYSLLASASKLWSCRASYTGIDALCWFLVTTLSSESDKQDAIHVDLRRGKSSTERPRQENASQPEHNTARSQPRERS